ncbi:MAG: S41 family peptidase [Patescibacteria group bacterium]
MPIKSTSFKNIIGAIVIVVLIAGAFYGGTVSGRAQEVQAQRLDAIINKETGMPTGVDFSLFWKAWKILDENYVDTHNNATTTIEERVYGAIKGMTAALGDPYTVFFPPVENSAFQTEIEGNFEGVGMEMGIKDGILTVISPLPGSPAKNAGMLAGDKVIKIDNKISTDMTVDEAVVLIRGKKGTQVTLTVLREGVKDPFEIKITRDVINLPVIETKLDPQTKIFTITLYSFSTQSANHFRSALREFVMSGSNKLILDLRGNPGGVLDAAVDMASWFLPPGKVVVREDYGEGKEETVERSRGYDIFNDNLKMVILIDGGSASASEILAGALKENGKATLVGTATFGKGSVQELVQIDDKTSLKVTVARWLTPSGKSISDGGLAPDIEVKLTEKDIAEKNDLQMKKAVEILSK